MITPQQLLQRVLSVFRRKRLDRELEAEFAAHLDLAMEENRQRGMSAEEARRQALIRFGGTEQAKELHRETRALPGLDTFVQDIRYAARGMGKSPGFTSAAVLTLALGIAVNAAMFSMVSAFLLRRPPGRDPERVVGINTVKPGGDLPGELNVASAPNYLAWREANDVFEQMAASDEYRTVSLTADGKTEALHSAAVTANYFDVLGVSAEAGRTFFASEDQPGHDHEVVLSHELWLRRFGSNPSLIGRNIRINREDYTVIGIMPANFRLLGLTPQLWTPLVISAADQTAAARKDRSLLLFARLKPGVTVAQARAEMQSLARRAEEDFPETEKGWGVGVRSLPDFLIYAIQIRNGLTVMMTAVCFVLLIACANVAGLLLARAGGRRKELAIRMSLGASRLRIVRQLLTEGVLVAGLGGGLGLLLSYWGIRFLAANLAFNEVIRAVPVELDRNVLIFAFLASVVSAILCALAPAITASRTDINLSLKDESRAASAGRSRSRLRSVLVTGEITLALFLLIGTGLLVHGLFLIEHQNLGFPTDHLLTASITLDKARYENAAQQSLFVQKLLPRLQEIPGAEFVAAVSDLPASGPNSVTLLIKGQPELPANQRPSALDVVATADFFHTARIPLLRGRTFSETDNAGTPPVVVVNEEFVRRYLHDQDALGKQVRLDVSGAAPVWSEIVGVVGNVKTFSEMSREDPEVYEPFLQRPIASFSLMIRSSSDPDGLTSALRKTIAESDVELPVTRVMSMTSVIERQKQGDPFFMQLLSTFAVLALILSAIGIYGLIAYSVGQRTHEIAIRMALGAGSREVHGMVLREGLKMTCIGGLIGLLLALPLPKLFNAIFSGFGAGSIALYIVVPVAVAVVSMLATYIPARRAAAIDPIIALHST